MPPILACVLCLCLIIPAAQRYDLWFNTSAYHNLPTIDNYDQRDGITYTAADVQYKGDGAVSKLTMGIVKAYPDAAGLIHWVRTVTPDNKAATITDKYQAKAPFQSLTQSITTMPGKNGHTRNSQLRRGQRPSA